MPKKCSIDSAILNMETRIKGVVPDGRCESHLTKSDD